MAENRPTRCHEITDDNVDRTNPPKVAPLKRTEATIYDVGAEARKLVKMADDLLSSDLVMYDHTREFLTEVRDSSKEFLRMEGHFNE